MKVHDIKLSYNKKKKNKHKRAHVYDSMDLCYKHEMAQVLVTWLLRACGV